MSSLSLPPDPYKLLGVPKDAKLPEIRSAHRKLVLQCHPDKVQDAALKAIKQDEFQKVQQAYELLSDDTKRLQYDEQLKLYELRKEMGRGIPTARSNPFEYEVKKTAEPRPNSYDTRSPIYARPAPKVYAHEPVHRSHEDIMYQESHQHHQFKKSASYDSTTDRKRASEKDDARFRADISQQRRREDEERATRAREKDIKRAHGEKKKSRDKDRRKGTDDKRTRTSGPFVEDYSDGEYSPRVSEKKSSRQLAEEEMSRRREEILRSRREDEIRQQILVEDMNRERERQREREKMDRAAAEAETRKEVLMTPKAIIHEDFHHQYTAAAKRKGEADSFAAAAAAAAAAFQHPGMRRSETYAAPTTRADYNVRHAAPHDFSDGDSPKRSAETRRASETPASRRERSRSRRSPSHHKESPLIIEPASTPTRKPTLHSHNSAPPILPRKEPSRSRTQDYPRSQAIPPLPRASTFGNDGHVRDREHRSSGRKKEVAAVDSEDDDHQYRSSPRYSSSPPRRKVETRYGIGSGGKAVQKQAESSRHRSELNSLSESYVTREQDDSPPGTSKRPSVMCMPSSETRPRTGTRTTSYFAPSQDYAQDSYAKDPYAKDPYAKDPYAKDPYANNNPYTKEPHIVTANRPAMARELSSRSNQFDSPKVKYTPLVTADKVIYSSKRTPEFYDSPRRNQQYYPSYGRTAGVHS